MGKIADLLTLGISDAEQRRNKLTEIYSMFLIFAQLAYAVFYLIIDSPVLLYQAIVQVVFSIPPAIALLFARKNNYHTARLWLTYFAPLPVIIGSVFFLGREAATHFYLLFYAVLPLTIFTFRHKAHIIILFWFNLLSFLSIEIFSLESLAVTRLPERYIAFHSIECYIICFIAVGVTMIMYQLAAEKYENLLHEQSDKMKDITLEVMEQKELADETNLLLMERQQLIEQQSEELQAINNELKEAVATKDKFFSIVAHDLKNPLHMLIGFSELLQKKKDQFDEEKKDKIFRAMHEGSTNAYKLLENLLTWARTQTEGIRVRPEELKIYEITHETGLLLDSMRIKKNIMLDIRMDKDMKIMADRFMITSVMNNLVSNAIKFTPAGGTITISSDSSLDGFMQLCISDTGVGIRQEDLSKLFRVDHHISTRGTDNERGTGLGLILCREFIEKNGGKIWVESEPGKGSRFCFTVKNA